MNLLEYDQDCPDDGAQERQLREAEVEEEEVVVADANAVIDPRAMVVIPLDATVADDAVPAAARADDLAFGAEASWVEGLKKLHEVNSADDASGVLLHAGDLEAEGGQVDYDANGYPLQVETDVAEQKLEDLNECQQEIVGDHSAPGALDLLELGSSA